MILKVLCPVFISNEYDILFGKVLIANIKYFMMQENIEEYRRSLFL